MIALKLGVTNSILFAVLATGTGRDATQPIVPQPAPVGPPPAAQDTELSPAPAHAPAPLQRSGPGPQMPQEPQEGPIHVCDFNFNAPQLLRYASDLGIRPIKLHSEGCDINPRDNQFFAEANRECKLRFANADWLIKGASLQAMRGVGQFSATVSATGVDVIIPARGGVAFKRIAVRITTTAPGCAAPKIADIVAQ